MSFIWFFTQFKASFFTTNFENCSFASFGVGIFALGFKGSFTVQELYHRNIKIVKSDIFQRFQLENIYKWNNEIEQTFISTMKRIISNFFMFKRFAVFGIWNKKIPEKSRDKPSRSWRVDLYLF